jgi:hypothetical protein
MSNSTPTFQLTSDALEGVWIGISHQTITITSMRGDYTFSGTYFTPSLDLRTTFSGKWTLSGEVLNLEYSESNPPFIRVPFTDQNRLEVVSSDLIVLHTLPSGISLPWKRVQFATPESVYGKPPRLKPISPPDLKTLKRMKQNDLNNQNPLLEWVFHLIDCSQKQLHDDKMVDALKDTIPEKAGYYYAIFVLEGLWGNGGMTHLLLREETAQNQYFLKTAAKGYDYFQSPEVAEFIRMLAKKTVIWMKKIKALTKRDAPEEAFAPIIAEVEAYDAVFDQLLQKKSKVEKALLKDIRTHPEDYILKKRKTRKSH